MGMAKGSMTLDANQFFNALKLVVSALGDLEGSSQEASSAVDGVETSLQGVGSDLSGIGKAQDEIEETATKSTELGENLKGTGDKGKEAGKTIKDTFDKIGNTLDTIGGKVAAVGDKLQTAGKKMSSAGGTLTRNLTVPIAAVGTYSLKTFADFEKGMSNVQAISGATGEELEALSEKAQEMGKNTKFTMTQATEALQYMAMAGWKTEDMLDGLEGIMSLAAASNEDLGTTSDIVTDALTAFGLSAKDSGHFADVLAKSASNSNTDVAEMGEAFKYVAPLAGTLGYTIEDVGLALGTMANSGIHASQAGTALRSALIDLTSPSKDVQNALVSLGLATTEMSREIDTKKLEKAQSDVETKTLNLKNAQLKYNEAVQKYGKNSTQAATALNNVSKAQIALENSQSKLNSEQEGTIENIKFVNNLVEDEQGNVRSLSEVMDMLREKIGELDTMQQEQILTQLFGERAVTGMMAIINSSAEDYDKLTTAVNNADGAAKEMSEIQLDNFAGQLTLLKSKADVVAYGIGKELVPALSDLLDKISEGLDWFSSLDQETKQLIIEGATVLALLGPILKVVGSLVSVIGLLVKGIGNVVAAIGWLIPKIGSALSGLASLATKGFGGLVIAAKAVGPKIGSALSTIGPIAGEALAVVGAAIAGWEIGSLIYDTWGPQIEEFLFPIFDFFVELWDDIVSFFTESIPEFFTTLGETISAGWNTIVEFFSGVFEAIKNFFVEIATYIWDNFLGPIVEAVTATVQKIYEIVAKIFEIIWALLSTAGKLIWDYVINPIWEGIKWLVDAIGNFFSGLWDSIVAIFTGVWDWVDETIITPLWEGIKWVVDEIAGFFSDLWDGIVEVFTGVADWFGGIFEDAWDAIVEVFEGVTDWFSELWEDIKEVFSDAATAVSDFFEAAFDTVFNWIMEGVEDVVNFFIDGINGVVDIINEIPGVDIGKLDRLKLPRLAVGLDYVPYDGYVAELHKGERVMTRQENEEYTNNRTYPEGGNTFNFYSPEPIDEITAAQEFKRVEKELAEGV